MLTSPLTLLAIAGVTLVPGEREYTIGRLSSLRTWNDVSHISLLKDAGKIFSTSIHMRIRNCRIPLTHSLFHLIPSHHQTHSHVSLQEQQKIYQHWCQNTGLHTHTYTHSQIIMKIKTYTIKSLPCYFYCIFFPTISPEWAHEGVWMHLKGLIWKNEDSYFC